MIAAVIRCGPAWISTSAMTPATSTEVTVPGNLFRAENESSVRWRAGARRSLSTSLAGTCRRFRESRVVRSFPAPSQRRSVSTLTPIARAASPMLRSVIARQYGSERICLCKRLRGGPERRMF